MGDKEKPSYHDRESDPYYEKKSFSELDKNRNKSRQISRDETEYNKPKSAEWMKKQLLRGAEKMFAGSKGTSEHARMQDAVHESYGSPNFDAAVTAYLEKYGMPDDMRTLLVLLESKNKETFLGALAKLNETIPSRSITEKRTIRTKLRVLELSVKDVQTKKAVKAALEKL